MNSCSKLTILFCALLATHGASAEGYVLELEIVNVQAGKGLLKIALHNSAANYQEANQVPFRGISVAADREIMTLRIEGVTQGWYAIKIYQDVNENDEIDSNFIGYPKEPFGFSNNPPVRFGPPGFKKASFEVTENQSVRVELR